MQKEHVAVTQAFQPDTIARLQLWYFPKFHSLSVSLNYSHRLQFEYHDSRNLDHGRDHKRLRGCRLQYDHSVLQAAFTLKQLSSLVLTVPASDCFGQLPWEAMTELKNFCILFNGRIAQGSFGFLPRIPALEHLQADLDFSSIPSLCCMTSLKSLELSVATPVKGAVDAVQARQQDDEVCYQLQKLTGLEKLDFCQQATISGLAHLINLPSLTHLVLRLVLPYYFGPAPKGGLRLWSVIKFLQGHKFHLQHLQFEFRLDSGFAVASLDNTLHSNDHGSEDELSFPVPWSTSQIAVRIFHVSRFLC